MQQRTFLTGLAVLILAAQACGSEDGKKRVNQSPDAGAGGEGGVIEPAAGGSSAGEPMVGTAGEPQVTAGMGGLGGMGGAGGAEPLPMAGAAGEPPVVIPPDPELLFSVKPSAEGLDGSAVFDAQNPQNEIYSSKSGAQATTAGTNALKLDGELLGLDPTDQIVAFALPQTEPATPTYLFSLADGSEGADRTRTWAADKPGRVAGNVFLSDGVQSFRDLGEGGENIGYNAMLATASSLGLLADVTNPADDLTGLAVHDANVPITEVYFVVNSTAVGAAGTAVASTPPLSKGCTVFKSGLDRKNAVAFTCAQLGLFVPIDNVEALGDQIDALAIYGTEQPSKVVFSVANGASGTDGSAVATAATTLTYQIGAALFTSSGNGQNALLKTPHDLGLGEWITDELDGLAVIDASTGAADRAGSCELTFDPLDATAGGGLSSISQVSHVGNVLVLSGPTAAQTTRWLAYNPKTCEFLQQLDLPSGFDAWPTLATVPLAGWTADKPLDKVEFWRLGTDSNGVLLTHYDVTGTFVQSFPITDTLYYDYPVGLAYDPLRDQLFAMTETSRPVLRVFPRPDASAQSITADVSYRTHPCGYSAELSGVDAAGNLVLGAPQTVANQMRVCHFTPEGEMQLMPYAWTVESFTYLQGFFASDGSHYFAHTDAAPISIERGLYHYP